MTVEQALAQVRREEAAKLQWWESDVRANRGLNTDPIPRPVPMSDAEALAEAERRIAARNHPDAVLKRALAALADAGSEEGYAAYCAALRGDAGWRERGLALVGAELKAA